MEGTTRIFLLTGLDTIKFPLLFTDNSKADPVQDKGATTFSGHCRMYANEGLDPGTKGNAIWESPTQNGKDKGYTPCPPYLMKDHKTDA